MRREGGRGERAQRSYNIFSIAFEHSMYSSYSHVFRFPLSLSTPSLLPPRKYKMIVGYNESNWDDNRSYVLDYRAQNHVLGYSQMRDEVRELRPGLFLCMGAWGWTERRQQLPAPFIMRGPKNQAEPENFKEETGINIREVSLN